MNTSTASLDIAGVNAPKAGPKAWFGLIALMLPVLLVSIDNTVLSFALPQISTALTPTAQQLLWMVDIYPLLLAGLLVTMGVLGDRVGRRRLLLIGAAGFGLVSLYAAFAPSAEHLIAARALLGLFGATLMPSTLSLLRNLFLHAGQRRLAIAIWASAFAGGTALGPIVGGWLLEHFWWGSIFLINTPLLLVLLVAAPLLVPESRNPHGARVDLISVALSLGAMLPLVYGIKSLAKDGIGLLGGASLLLGLVLGTLFVRRQLRHAAEGRDPLLDVRLFARPVFTASIFANFLSILAFSGLIFFVSQYLQLVLGLPALEAGLALLPGAIASIAAGLLAVPLAKLLPIRILIPAGMLLAAAGYAVATQLGADSTATLIIVVFVLVGAGVGLAETLTNDAILSSVPSERAGAASGISETAYELGASLGVAILGSVMAGIYRGALVLPEGLTAAQSAQASETLGGAIAVADGLDDSLGDALAASAREAFSTGVDVAALSGTITVLLSTVVVAVLLHRAARGRKAATRDARPEARS